MSTTPNGNQTCNSSSVIISVKRTPISKYQKLDNKRGSGDRKKLVDVFASRISSRRLSDLCMLEPLLCEAGEKEIDVFSRKGSASSDSICSSSSSWVPSIPANESERVLCLHSYNLLDKPSNILLDGFSQIASEVCGSKMSFISLVDSHRQWILSAHGTELKETTREISFCSHTIFSNNSIMIVEDALLSTQFMNHPLVKHEPFLRFYAGVPLKGPDDLAIGTFCVADTVPKSLSDKQIELMKLMAHQIMEILNLQRENRLMSGLVQKLKEM